jgi:hypothetical protein
MRRITISGAGCFAVGALPMLGLLLLAGCSGSQGPHRYDLSGKVIYRGAPVPAGYILFVPDGENGNPGPGAHALIVDGVYRTPPSRGTIGGPHWVTIVGFDNSKPEADRNPEEQAHRHHGPRFDRRGKRLFPTFQVQIDLPRQAATYDFVVPGQ